MRGVLVTILGGSLAITALGGHANDLSKQAAASDLRKQIVASTLVTGSVQISPEGKVSSYTIDQADKLAPVVRDLIQKNVPTWKFERTITLPVDITVRMTLRLLAKAVDGKHDTLSIVAASFDDDFESDDEQVRMRKMVAPIYPRMALNARVTGTVYTLILVGRDGRVQEALAEQVNLRTAVAPRDQERFRKNLADAVLKAAWVWTWDIPTSGRYASAPAWWVRVPVSFIGHELGWGKPKEPGYGEWEVYIPGPRLQLTSESAPPDLRAQGSDAITDGSIHQATSAVQLTTPLGGG